MLKMPSGRCNSVLASKHGSVSMSSHSFTDGMNAGNLSPFSSAS